MQTLGKILYSNITGDLVLDGADFYFISQTRPAQLLSVEQVYQLNNVNSIQWVSPQVQNQILDHYTKITGQKIEKPISQVEIISPTSDNWFATTIKSIFSNTIVKLIISILVILVVGIVVIVGGKFVMFSNSVGISSAKNLLEKTQELNDKSSEDFAKYSYQYDDNNNDTQKSIGFKKVVNKITNDSEKYLDINALYKSTANRLIKNNELTTTEIESANKFFVGAKKGKNEWGLSGEERLLAYVLFSSDADYYDAGISESYELSTVLNSINNQINSLDPIYRDTKLKKAKITAIKDQPNTFQYKNNDNVVKFVVTNSRIQGPRFGDIY